MRFVFMDESGTGDPAREPFVTFAAIIVNADKQLAKLEEYLGQMAAEFVPPAKRQHFQGFHAVELYAGGKIFERDKEKRDRWWHILDELATIPAKFDLPIAWGQVPRRYFLPGTKLYENAKKSRIDPVVAAQMVAFTQATIGVNHWFTKAADPGEIGQVVLENNEHSKRFIKVVHRVLADPTSRHKALPDALEALRTVTHLRWPVYFEEKGESNATQLADFCAWALARRLRGAEHSERFCQPLLPYLVNKIPSSPDGVFIGPEGDQ